MYTLQNYFTWEIHCLMISSYSVLMSGYQVGQLIRWSLVVPGQYLTAPPWLSSWKLHRLQRLRCADPPWFGWRNWGDRGGRAWCWGVSTGLTHIFHFISVIHLVYCVYADNRWEHTGRKLLLLHKSRGRGASADYNPRPRWTFLASSGGWLWSALWCMLFSSIQLAI